MKIRARPLDYTYDCECYPNFFSASIKHSISGKRWSFEISQWKNQGLELYALLCMLERIGANLIGFNNVGYDWPLLDEVMENFGRVTHTYLYRKSTAILAIPLGQKNPFIIWPNEQKIKQIDLQKIHHFDRRGAMISLKICEFNMRSHNIKDLPIAPGTVLTRPQADEILNYNDHDVDETEKLYFETYDKIIFRKKLTDKYQRDFMNHNDTKIGKDYFAMELNKAGIKTKDKFGVIQSRRDFINCRDVMLPYLHFENPEFNRIKDFFLNSTIDEKDENGLLKLKGFFKKVNCEIDGLKFQFGAGGIHASRKTEICRASDTHDLLDWDVESFYPKLAIANGFYPEHLTKKFCEIYIDVFSQRKSFPKGTIENEMLKLALNGVYGDSNEPFSIFHDPKYTVSITINGQLLLCMLAEQLMKIPDLRMIQLNTDGLTFLCPKEYREHAKNLWDWWQKLTNLTLEEAEYDSMYIRDVNNYMAKKKSGKIKRIGCYAYETALENPATRELVFRKDWGKRVVAKAAEAALVRNENIETFIRNHDDKMDFMLRTKVPRSSSLNLETKKFWENKEIGLQTESLQNISRYYVSKNGGSLIKIMPCTKPQIERWQSEEHYFHIDTGAHKVVTRGKKPPSGKYKLGVMPSPTPPDRRISIEAGLLVKDCSNMDDFDGDINYDYYIEEARKIVNPLLLGTQS